MITDTYLSFELYQQEKNNSFYLLLFQVTSLLQLYDILLHLHKNILMLLMLFHQLVFRQKISVFFLVIFFHRKIIRVYLLYILHLYFQISANLFLDLFQNLHISNFHNVLFRIFLLYMFFQLASLREQLTVSYFEIFSNLSILLLFLFPYYHPLMPIIPYKFKKVNFSMYFFELIRYRMHNYQILFTLILK